MVLFVGSGFSSGLLGNIPNLKWSFSLSHTRLLNGGWIREQTVTDLPPCELVLIEPRTRRSESDLDSQRRRSQPQSFASLRTLTVNCECEHFRSLD